MKSYRPICGSHAKIGPVYIQYNITDISEVESDINEYELTIRVNDRIIKQMKASDDKILRAYISGYIEGLYLFKSEMKRGQTSKNDS